MARLTITVDPELLRRARMRAVEQGTSVNAVLREYLETYAARGEERRRAIERVLRASRTARSGRGTRRWTREELHER